MRKTTAFLLLFFCCMFTTRGQFYKSVLSPEVFSDSIAIIIKDFKQNFSTIEGSQFPSQGETDVFESTVTIPGALHCAIYRYHSVRDTTASWQAIMYEGDSYAQAVKIYKTTCRRLKNSRMKWPDKSIISFEGELNIPDENVGFAVTTLRLNTIDHRFRNFVGEIELISNYDGWAVQLNLHKRTDVGMK